jgi:hypothetical protein
MDSANTTAVVAAYTTWRQNAPKTPAVKFACPAI